MQWEGGEVTLLFTSRMLNIFHQIQERSAKLWGGMSTFLTGDDSKQENTIQ